MKLSLLRILPVVVAFAACQDINAPVTTRTPRRADKSIAVIAAGVTDLGTLGGMSAIARSVNSGGVIVGSSQTATGDTHAFIWDPTAQAMRDIGTLGGTFSDAHAIDDAGRVVGVSTRIDNVPRPFLWDAVGGMREIPGTLPGRRSGIANAIAGTLIVGEMNADADGGGDLERRGFVYDLSSSALRDLGSVNDGYSIATGVNASGRIVGFSSTGCCWVPVTWNGASGGLTQIPLDPLGGGYGAAYGINAAGSIVGTTDKAPFGNPVLGLTIWSSSTAIPVMTTPNVVNGFDASSANVVSSSGYVAGYLYRFADNLTHAMFWDPTTRTMTDLSAALSGLIGDALAVSESTNGSVTVVGYQRTVDGRQHAVMFTGALPRFPVTLSLFPFSPFLPPVPVLYDPVTPTQSTPAVIAILGSSSLAVGELLTQKSLVDLSSVRLGKTSVAQLLGRFVTSVADVNHDGIPDLVVTFRTDELVLNGDLSTAVRTPQPVVLTAMMLDKRQIIGNTSIILTPKPAALPDR